MLCPFELGWLRSCSWTDQLPAERFLPTYTVVIGTKLEASWSFPPGITVEVVSCWLIPAPLAWIIVQFCPRSFMGTFMWVPELEVEFWIGLENVAWYAPPVSIDSNWLTTEPGVPWL